MRETLTPEQLAWHQSETHRAYQGGKKAGKADAVEIAEIVLSTVASEITVDIEMVGNCVECGQSHSVYMTRSPTVGSLLRGERAFTLHRDKWLQAAARCNACRDRQVEHDLRAQEQRAARGEP